MAVKRGFFFSVDAIVAVLILSLGLLFFSQMYAQQGRVSHLRYAADDLLGVLSELRVGEVNSSYVEGLIQSGYITNLNHSLLEQIVEFHVLNRSDQATGLLEDVTAGMLPQNAGWILEVDGEGIFSLNRSQQRQLVVARKMISGYQRDKPVSGTASRVFLSGIKNKSVSSYAYLGGFAGQGNLSLLLELPEDMVMRGLYLEMDAGDDFSVGINGEECATGQPPNVSMEAGGWDLSSCMSSLSPGTNEISLEFAGGLSGAYAGGGFVRATYWTSEFGGQALTDQERLPLPGIKGIINLYSGVIVPGTLHNMRIYLHFFADTGNSSNTLYVTIANTTVYRSVNPGGEGSVLLSNLSAILDFTSLGSSTLPLRIGFENVSFASVFGGNADVVTITDLSQSMDRRMNANALGTLRNCGDASFEDPTSRRLSVAKCLDKQFAETLLNASGNLVGLIAFTDTTDDSRTVNLTADLDPILTTIGNSSPLTGYTSSGATCICCGINSAKDMIIEGKGHATLISQGSSWLYNDTFSGSRPADDAANLSWYEREYEDSGWKSGTAILGNSNGSAVQPLVTTEVTGNASNATGSYYFRKHLTLNSLAQARRAFINILADEYAMVYVNGQKVENGTPSGDAEYWNRRGREIPEGVLVQGDNVIAVELRNTQGPAKMDLELIGVNSSRGAAMLMMTDGAASGSGSCSQSGTPTERAILSACEAKEDYGITVHAVGYSSEVDTDTLEAVAACGEGMYLTSTNITELEEFYSEVASSILFATQHAQTIEIEGDPAPSVLFNDSYVELNYTPSAEAPGFGEIAFSFEETGFGSCSFSANISSSLRVTDARLTSYSAEHWTDSLVVNGNLAYNLSASSPDYTLLGDPFVLLVPVGLLQTGTNTFSLNTGDSPLNSSGCTPNATFIYTAAIRTETSYGPVLPSGEGCTWTLESTAGTGEVKVPAGYEGEKRCSYTSLNISYDPQDSLQQAAYDLVRKMDFDQDGVLDVSLDASNLKAESVSVTEVPYLWGPAIVEMRAWQ